MTNSFDHRDNPYQRPNDTFHCARTGQPCLSGPTKKGHCQGGYECKPVNRGYRWYCTRPAVQGGPCQDGPLPEGGCSRKQVTCTPIRSVRSRRARFVIWISALTASIVLMCLNADHMLSFISPGPLSTHHSAIVESCSDCHSAANLSALELPGKAIAPASAHDEAQLCISCHPRGAEPLNHHGLAVEELERLTEKALEREKGLPATGLLSPRHAEQGLSCATCHQEHRGQMADLKVMAKERCQACHVKRYDGLVPDHPEFSQYPYARRTRLNFDHVAHFNQHFEDEADLAPETCGDCHTPSPTGQHMLITNFEKTCKSCHNDDVRAVGRAGAAGFAVFSVPALDGESLIESEIEIGQWPMFSDASMTPFMRLLLSGDPQIQKDFEALDEWDLDDLYDAEDETREAAGRIALGIKELVYDIATGGQSALVARVEGLLEQPLSEEERSQIAGLLPGSAMTLVREQWWPNLAEEMVAIHSKKSVPTDIFRRKRASSKKSADDKPTPVQVSNEDWMAFGGWYLDGDVLRYRPAGHKDPFLKAWISLTARVHEVKAAKDEANTLFRHLTRDKAPGKCASCHSIDKTDAGVVVNWAPFRPDESRREFTHFTHAAHFTLMSKDGCVDCHKLDGKADYAAGFKDQDPHTFASNFHAQKRDLCADCHNPEQAGDDCLTCHNYHVGSFPPDGLIKARLKSGGGVQQEK